MKANKTKNLRNISLLGHSGAGKTTLSEAILYYTKNIDRCGKVEEENTTSDYEAEEKKRKISINASILPCSYNDIKINIIDTPGYFDFIGEVISSLEASDSALIVVSGKAGVKVGTEKSWELSKNKKLSKIVFVNKLDEENSDFFKVLQELKDVFGNSILPVQYPIGKEKELQGIVDLIKMKAYKLNNKNLESEEIQIPEDIANEVEEYRQVLIETLVSNDEELMEKYFNNEEITEEEITEILKSEIIKGEIVPVLCGSSTNFVGIKELLDSINSYFPSPIEAGNVMNYNNKDGDTKSVSSDFVAHVFKTIADPFVGKLSIFKVLSGNVKSEVVAYNINKEKEEKIGNIYLLRGKNQTVIKEVVAGDIAAISKLSFTSTGDILSSKNTEKYSKEIKFPLPTMSMSIVPTAKGDDEKIAQGLNKLLEEDLTFKLERNNETNETIISGIGEVHLDVIISKLKQKFGVQATLKIPRVPYRETIKGSSDVQGKYKKQSGGHGQYGDVHIKFQPRDDGQTELLFVDNIVGGVVPRQYIPAVEKGLKECMEHGVLAGFPVIGLKAILHYGSYHTVDSSEMAFKVAASLAYKKGLDIAKPILLEPIMKLEVQVPNSYLGDIIGDLNKKRGKIISLIEEDKMQKVIAEVPMAEMFKYTTELKSITGGRGSFSIDFEKYEEVPKEEVDKIINQNKL
ncbi:MAG: elongation factor G [Clostridiaceae bacterium]